MSRTRFSSLGNRAKAALSGAAFLLGCAGEPPPNLGIMPPNSAEEVAIKALKDKFYLEANCAVYQKIVTFSCESGVVQVMCKDMAGMAQVGYYLRDTTRPDGWYSEKDVDAQIAEAQARLAEAQAKKAGFIPAHNPGYQCSPL